MGCRTPLVERAFQIARSGACENVHAIRKALTKEGYEGVYGHLAGRTLLDQWQRLRREARRVDHAPDARPPDDDSRGKHSP